MTHCPSPSSQEIFSVAGPVLGVKIVPDRNFQHDGLNYGFVGP
jgi:nucleolysin TIA-1/TIAR